VTISLWRIAAGVVAATACWIAVVYAYCIAMPGASYRGHAPLLSANERALAAELATDVRALSVDIGVRRATVDDSLSRAEQYVRRQLELIATPLRLKVERESLVHAQGDPANVYLDFPGVGRSPWLIIGAHYDSAPGGTPGANDNATGVAAALALARRFSTIRHALPVRFVLFANEEPPYFQTEAMGSMQHAAGCRRRNEQVRAMLSLETMGYYSDQPGSQLYPPPLDLLYPDRGNFIAFIGNLSARALVRDVIREFRRNATIPSEAASLPELLPGVGWSDHWSFSQYGYSALMATDTAVFRDPNYHETTDLMSNLDFDKLARVVSGLQRTLERLASP
jgi:Peptidase family M28